MLTKNECDLIWKIMHGGIPTGRFFMGVNFWILLIVLVVANLMI